MPQALPDLYVSDFYPNLRAVASRLLTTYGQNLTFTRKTSTGYNAATGVNTLTTSQFSAHGAAFEYNAAEIDGTNIQRGDLRLLLEWATTAPILGDTVTIDGLVYRVMNIQPTNPGGVVVMNELQLRR